MPFRIVLPLVLLVVLTQVDTAPGQKPAPPAKPNPQAPTLNMPNPLGVKRGTTLELSLTGTNLANPTGLWTSFPAKVTIPTDNNNGKDNAKLRVVLEVPKDAPLGFHRLALATTRGMSNFRAFCVDDLPQLLEAEGNRAKATPQALPYPCVVVGRIDPEASKYFKVAVKAGERLTFEVLGRRLGTAIDPQLSLYDPRSGRELAHDNDAPGCQNDPRLTYTFKDAGEYLLEIKDVINRGGPDYWYRLRVGDFPCATVPIPMAAKRGSKVRVGFAGTQVADVQPVEVNVPMDPHVNVVWVVPRGANGLPGWPVALGVSDVEEVVEHEPNDEPAKANEVPVPGGVTGRFERHEDLDYFRFKATKGQKLLIEARTLELNSPTLVYMVVKNDKGVEVAKTNPAAAPPADQRIEFTAPADGSYLLEVQHLNYLGGPTEAYHIRIVPNVPGFDVTLGIDRYDVPAGGTLSLPLFVTRRGYTGPIDVSVVGPAKLSGQVTIPANAPPKPNLPAATLTLTVPPDMTVGPYLLSLQAKATIEGKQVAEFVDVSGLVRQGMANLPYPPPQFGDQIGLAVTERAPFTLAAIFDRTEVVPGMPADVTLTVQRLSGFEDEITFAPPTGFPPKEAVPALKPIPKGLNVARAAIQLTPSAAPGKFAVTFHARAKYHGTEFAVQAPPASLVVVRPFDLSVAPAPVMLTQGGKAKLKVNATRRGGFDGPIQVELRNLPANVTAAKATIPAGQGEVFVEIAAADNAPVASKMDVNVLGTAPTLGNQQNASPNFGINILKK
jgi:hypothetical protein